MSNIVSAILSGDVPASAAMGRANLYDALNAGATGRLPFLGGSAKIDAGQSVGVLSAVLYMQPARESGREACAGRSDGCTAACLAESTGRMSGTGPRQARRRRHASFYADRARFLSDLHTEIQAHERKAKRAGKIAAIRLNGTTDLPWHRMPFTDSDGIRWANLHTANPGVQFYDYTKLPLAIQRKGSIPPNLHLTFSLSDREDSDRHATAYLAAGLNVAMVAAIAKHAGPATVLLGGHTWPTIDGDEHDARFLDFPGSVVLLAAKGRAKRDETGFVRTIA